jgi:hypothetical protein
VGVISSEEQEEYYKIYNEIRTPVVHGLTLRLYKNIFEKEADGIFLFTNQRELYKKVSKKLILTIYELTQKDWFLKK